jgi:hypothetical protein
LVLLFNSVHVFVKFEDLTVAKVLVLSQAPLSAAVRVAVAVLWPGEVDPLRVAKFVAHKVEVCLASEALDQKFDHLVKGYTSIHLERAAVLGHARVDLFIKEPLRNGFVPNDSLIV